jgi:2-(1,2-epoxy-1,2-dihydrophenyl)acetyl-CoA isomerase
MNASGAVERHRHGAVMELRLNRPARLNALTLAASRELLEAVRQAVADPDVRALLLSGTGTSFCAGKDKDDPASAEFVDALQGLAAALMNCAQPVVACVQGWVVGAGLELMLNCDIVVAARSARFMLPEVRLGLFGTGAVTSLLPAAVGLPRAKALLMRGQPFGAEEAERWGLVAAVVDDDRPLPVALEQAAQLAASDRDVLAGTKQLLHRAALGDVTDALAREAQAHLPPRAG